MKNCLDIVRPFAAALDERTITNVQMFGGIGSAALMHPEVEILPDEGLVVMHDELILPQYRDAAGRNLRDLDCLVLATDEAAVAAAEQAAADTVGTDLELSFFGLRPMSQLNDQRHNQAASLALVHVSDRYVAESEGKITHARKALFPFVVDMDVSTLDTWRLMIAGGNPMPIPHPGVTLLNYLSRSESGLRPKDEPKLNAMTSNIAAKAPGVIDWVMDGPGASQLELARILHTLREPEYGAKPLNVGGVIRIAPYGFWPDLIDHEAYMRGRPGLAEAVLKAARLKSRGVHMAESSEGLVDFWQRKVEPRISTILKNET